MNVASLKLCKTLYEVSGWDGTLVKHMTGVRHASQFESTVEVISVNDKFVGPYEDNRVGRDECEGEYSSNYVPAYDLGFLLRKLAKQTTLAVRYVDADNHHGIDLKQWYGKWIAYTPSMEQRIYPYADTPEDAACSLAIALFEQGVLTKGGQE